MKQENEKFYVTIPSSLIFQLADHPLALLVLQYILIRKKVFQKFYVGEIARTLNKSRNGIRDAFEILKDLKIIKLQGINGSQFYSFQQENLEPYFKINPFETATPSNNEVDPFKKCRGTPAKNEGGTPSNSEGGPLQKVKGIDIKNREEKEKEEKNREENTKTRFDFPAKQTFEGFVSEWGNGNLNDAINRFFDSPL